SDRPLAICTGPDGNLWYTAADGTKIGRWQIAQPGRNYVLSMDAGLTPTVRNSGLGETVQWIFNGPSTHSVTDISTLNLFASGPKEPTSFFSYTFSAAGAYVYKDISPNYHRAAINVRVVAPLTGNVGVQFQLQWANPSVPGGYIEDIVVQTPGSQVYVPVTSSIANGGPYTPTVPGQYLFRGRLRNLSTGAACTFSRPTLVTVI
ncbi:MAG TPA: hypothetical protein VM509_12430, partial [Planctomycetota bacterium]|nr:hypothetical protein [Planctomycetota bacterium]